MRRIEGRGNRHHRPRLGDAMRGGEHRRAAEAMSDQDRWRGERAAQMVGGRDQIVDVRRKRRVGELAFTCAQAGEIEPQRRNAALLQPIGDVAGCPIVLAASKAVREQRDRAISVSGRSSRAASVWPSALRKSKRSAGMNISCAGIALQYRSRRP